MTRTGSPYLALELRDRTGTIPARVFRDADALARRFRARRVGARGRAGRAVPRRARARGLPRSLRARTPADGSTRRASCRPPTATSTSSTGSSSTSRARSTIRAYRALLDSLLADARAARRVAAGAVHARRPPRLPRRAARAHRRGGDARARGVPAAPAPELRPAADGGDRPRHRADREFTYGAEIGLTDEGRCSATSRSVSGCCWRAPAGSTTSAGSRCSTACSATTGPAAAPGGRFGSPEALALYRLNALDASVKGALEHGLQRGG